MVVSRIDKYYFRFELWRYGLDFTHHPNCSQNKIRSKQGLISMFWSFLWQRDRDILCNKITSASTSGLNDKATTYFNLNLPSIHDRPSGPLLSRRRCHWACPQDSRKIWKPMFGRNYEDDLTKMFLVSATYCSEHNFRLISSSKSLRFESRGMV